MGVLFYSGVEIVYEAMSCNFADVQKAMKNRRTSSGWVSSAIFP